MRALRERIGLRDYPRDRHVWELLAVMVDAGEVREGLHRAPRPCVLRGHDGVPVLYLTSRMPRRRQVRAVFEELAHILLCGPGLACLPPEHTPRLRVFIAADDRDEHEADALWLAWLLPRELLMRDFHEGAILEASGCAPADLNERMEMFLR